MPATVIAVHLNPIVTPILGVSPVLVSLKKTTPSI